MPEMVMLETEEKMDKAIEGYSHELSGVRTGRANPTLLDPITIDYYGVKTPIKQVASITVPEANQLYIKPFDRSTIKTIEGALNASSLGLTPQNDGTGIRLVFPMMTEDRRKELTKYVSKLEEAAKVAIRNIRREGNEDIKKLKLTEDDEKGYLSDIQELTDKKIVVLEELTKKKDQELMSI